MATPALGARPAQAGPGQAPRDVIYLPLVHQAPPGSLSPAGSAWGQARTVAADGSLVLIGEGSQVASYSLGDDSAPAPLGRSDTLDGIVRDILWDGGETAFVVTRATGARLSPGYAPFGPLAVSAIGGDWRAPKVIARAIVTGFAEIQIHRQHAFVCVGNGFTVYDLSDPADWQPVTSVALPGGPPADGLFVCRHDGEHTLGVLGNRQAQLLRYDVADPARPSLVATDETGVSRFFIGDFAIAAGQVHAIWRATPIAGVPQYTYVPSSTFPGTGVPKYDFGAEQPLPPYCAVAWPTSARLRTPAARVRSRSSIREGPPS